MAARVGSGRLKIGDVARLLATWLLSAGALGVADALLPGLRASGFLRYLIAVLVSAVVGLLIRPTLAAVAARIGWVTVVLAGLLAQAVTTYVALLTVPGISATFSAALWASWIVAATGTLTAWLGSSGTDDAFVSALSRRRLRVKPVADPSVDGVVFVQVNGVPFPVLRWAIQAGGVPTMRRWVTSGEYVLREWTPLLPCTTPASQLGILHGTIDGVPAFRWYDRDLGRVLVANRPDDARIIEARATTGDGLLADGGISVSNLFSGDAPRTMMTMSRLGPSRGSVRARSTVSWFLATPQGFMRGLIRTVAEIVKERFQASRQRRRDIVPRVHRGWTFAGLRAATNVLGRDLNTAVVAEEMRRGTPSIYVNYVDYDEIAHHAGMFRPESLAALDGLDGGSPPSRRWPRVLRGATTSWCCRTTASPRALPSRRATAPVSATCAPSSWLSASRPSTPRSRGGRADAVAEEAAHSRVSGRVAEGAAVRARRGVEAGGGEVGAGEGGQQVTVLGSGNLGLIYVHAEERLSLDSLEKRWPDLVPGLLAHPGVGFVAGVDEAGHSWALGQDGRHDLETGTVTGADPLAGLGPQAARGVRRALSMPQAPDLYVNSQVDEGTLDVAAFEPLVGAHGGLGGWQDRAYRRSTPAPPGVGCHAGQVGSAHGSGATEGVTHLRHRSRSRREPAARVGHRFH